MEYGRPYAPTAYYIYMRGSCDVVKRGTVFIVLFSYGQLNLGLGWHYAMKPSVILKQKNPEFSKLPS